VSEAVEQQEPVTQAPPAPQGLAAQYELGEETAGPAPAATAAATPPAPEAPALNAAGLPYDPATGRLLPRTTPAEPAPAAPEAAASPPATLSPLRRLAQDFGIDHEALAEESVEAAVRAAQRTLLRLQEGEGRRADIQRAAEASRQQAPAAPPQAPPEEFDLGLSPQEAEDIHPAVLSILRRALKPLADKARALERQVGYLTSGFHGQVQETNTARLDRALSALGDPRLGTARRHELADDDPLVARRSAVVALASKLAGKDATVHQVCAKVKEARDLFYGDAPATPPPPPARKNGAPVPDEWLAGGLRRPTHRNGAAEPKGPEAAVAAVAQQIREYGGASGEPDGPDDFPG